MAEITAAQVNTLREKTNVGMMNCKKALMETNGDIDAAVDLLRKRGMATAVKKASRDAKDGVIATYIAPGAKVGVLAEVNCETDFVARNDMFRAFCEDVVRTLSTNPTADFETARQQCVAKTGENMKIARHVRWELQGTGLVAAYIHTGSKVGVLVEVGANKEATASNEEFKQLVKDITLQIAAAMPIAVSRENVDPAIVEKEKEIAREQVKNKPPQAIEKIIAGKLDKFFQTVCLLDQGFVKKNSEISVREHIANVQKTLDEQIVVRRFVRFQVGEAFA
jgi:elongation factor Ts